MAIDWTAIRTEYITTGIGYRALAKKHGVSYTAIAAKGNKEGWVDQRDQHNIKTTSNIVDAICDEKVDRATRLQNAADKLLEIVEAHLAGDPKEITSQALKRISGVLKDIKDVQRTSKDLEEQDARIDSLRMQANKGASSKDVTVEMSEEVEALSG